MLGIKFCDRVKVSSSHISLVKNKALLISELNDENPSKLKYSNESDVDNIELVKRK
ncbi:hypothetical protein [Vibrio viridaestus]|uniref:hypothetical protein n=1 Tax=Vibrio viridaestus TaxID=2487322 RepID=UPI00140B87D1|nr:hypothetical protein [Vibrio viridaestus]